MTAKVLEWVGIFSIIVILIVVMPSVSQYPMPQWLIENIAQLFVYMKLIVKFPVVDTVFKLGFTFFMYIWLPIQGWNLILKILGLFPSLEHLKRFQIKDH